VSSDWLQQKDRKIGERKLGCSGCSGHTERIGLMFRIHREYIADAQFPDMGSILLQ